MPDGSPISPKKKYGLKMDTFEEVDKDVLNPDTGKKERRKYFRRVKVRDPSVPDPFPMADGFEENAVFYDLTYIEPSVLTSNLAFDEVAPLLWMAGGSEGPVIMLGDTDPEDASYEVTDTYGVLFDCTWVSEFVDECRQRGVRYAFVVTDIDRQYRDVCSRLRGVDVRQLYRSYLRSFEIGQDR